MGNFKNTKYGSASVSNAAGGGAGAGGYLWTDVANQGTTMYGAGKDVADWDLVNGSGTILQVAPAEVIRDLPGYLVYEIDPGPPPVLFNELPTDILIDRDGVDPLWDGSGSTEAVWVPVADLTQISWTATAPCDDAGALVALAAWARWSDGGSYHRFGSLIQLIVTDSQGLCAGP